MTERPVVRCLMAFPLSEGRVCSITHLVDLEEAKQRKLEGWWLIGPDPADWSALQEWEAMQPWFKRW